MSAANLFTSDSWPQRALRSALALSALMSFIMTSANAASNEPETAANAVLEDHYPIQTVNYPDGVVSQANLVYSQLDGYRPMTLDLYQPAGKAPASGYPLVVYIHGGGWSGGHSRNSGAFVDFPKVLASLAAKGYVVASINYRLSREASFPAAIQDVKASIRWLRARATQYGIDKSRAYVWGGSAGGQLAGLAVTACNVDALNPVLPKDSPSLKESDCVQGAVLWYPVTDFVSTVRTQLAGAGGAIADNPVTRYLGCAPLQACSESVLQLASPLSHVSNKTPPVLMVHGVIDRVVPASQSQLFHDKLKTLGKSELLLIPDVDHSFVAKTAESTHSASIQALTRSFAFFDELSGKTR